MAEILHYMKRIADKYQVPFGIAIWGFTAPGKAKEILVDSEGRLQVVGTVTASVDFSELMGADDRTLTDLYNQIGARASESTLSSILAQLDITLSALRDAIRGTGNKTLTDLESDLSSILGQLDITLSALRDALRGTDDRTLTDLYNPLANYLPNIDVPVSALLRLRIYEQTFEDGTTDLIAENCTQTVQSTQVYGGSYALDVTIADGVTGSVTTPTRPVSANQRVTFSFAHKENEYISDVKLIVIWRREAGGIIDTEEFTLTPSTSWQVDSRTLVAPKKATSMELRIQATASGGEGHVYLDELAIDLVGQIFRVDGVGNLKVRDDMLDVALSTRASESTLSDVKALLDKLEDALASVGADKLRASIVDALPESPFNLSKVAGTPLTGRDWSNDFAKLQNLDIALSAHRDDLRTDIRWLGSTALVPVSGKGAAMPSWDTDHWRDDTTYTVTETSYTEKTRCNFRPRSTRYTAYVLFVYVRGYIDTSGETLYVRLRSWYRGVLWEKTITSTSEVGVGGHAFYVKPFHVDDPLMIEAYVTAGTGYIKSARIDFVPLEGLILGRYYESTDDRLDAVKPVRVDADGYLLMRCVPP